MKLDLKIDFAIGDVVFMRTCDEPHRGLVTGILIKPNEVLYEVTWGNDRSLNYYFGFEITSEFVPEYTR